MCQLVDKTSFVVSAVKLIISGTHWKLFRFCRVGAYDIVSFWISLLTTHELTYEAPMMKSELRSAPIRKTASATLPVQDGKANLVAPDVQSTEAMLALLGSMTAYSPALS